MKSTMKLAVMIVAVIGALAVMPAAQASVLTYTLTVNGCSGTGGCGTGPFGNITLTDISGGVSVSLVLASGERFAGSGAGDALEFNVVPANTITNFGNPTDFGVGPAPDTASTFGTFLESATCKTCVGGQAGNSAGPLVFQVLGSGITVNSFTANAGGYFFAADIVGNGNTGNVGARGPTSAVPEPISLSLVGGGLLALGLFRRRFVA